jgi:hypothetical protein
MAKCKQHRDGIIEKFLKFVEDGKEGNIQDFYDSIDLPKDERTEELGAACAYAMTEMIDEELSDKELGK